MPELGEPLSGREIDVLNCLVKGAANKEIALELSISPNTVKVHVRNIFTKLGAQSRTEATRIAFEKRLVAVQSDEPAPEVHSDTEPVAGSPKVEESVSTDVDEEVNEAETAVSPPTQNTSGTISPSPQPNLQLNLRTAIFGLFALIIIIAIVVVSINYINDINTPATPTPPPTPYPETDLGNNWTESAPINQPTTNMASIAIGLQVYLIGGQTDAGITNAVQIYDTVSTVWSEGEKKPTAVTDTTTAALFGEIYVPGGRLEDGSVTNVVEVYSPGNNAWRTVASLPQPIAGGLTISDGSFLYLFGGTNDAETLDSVYKYDFETDSWQNLPEMNQARVFAAGDVINGFLYVVGGENIEGALASCEFFDPTEDYWTTCADMQQARSQAGAVTLVNRLYVIGGFNGNQNEIYNPETDEWTDLTTPISRNEVWQTPGISRVETEIYAMGGQFGDEISDRNILYAPLAYRTYLPAASSSGGE